MKACPHCQSTYEDWIEFCFNDGIPLVAYEPKPAAAPRPPPKPAASSAFDAPDARLVSGADLPEPAHLSRFARAQLDAPEPARLPTPPRAEDPRGLPEALSAPRPIPAPLADRGPAAPAVDEDEATSIPEPPRSPFGASAEDLPEPPSRAAFELPPSPPPAVAEPVRAPDPAPSVVPSVPEPSFAEEATDVSPPPPPAPFVASPVAAAAPPAVDAAPAPVAPAPAFEADALSELASALGQPSVDSEAGTRPFLAPQPAVESEDDRGTVPMFPPMPEEPPARSVLDDDDDGSRKRAAAGAGVGVALIGLVGFVAVAVVLAGGAWWWSSRSSAPREVADARPATPTVLPAPAAPAPPPADPAAAAAAAAPPVADASAPAAAAPPAPVPAPAPTAAAHPTSAPAASAPTSTASSAPTRATAGANASTGAPARTPPASTPTRASTTTSPATAPPTSGAPDASVTSDSVWGSPTAPTTGFLRIVTDPDGATVYVNDVAKGKTPVVVELPYGAHEVKVVRSGYKTEVRDVNIRVRELTVPFNLKPEVLTGQVNVYGPDGFSLMVDGRDMGPLPVAVTVSEGVRQFKLVGPGGQSCNLSRDVKFKGQGRPETITLACP